MAENVGSGATEVCDKSDEAVVLLWQELDEAIKDYDLLKDGNNSLLAECHALRVQVSDLKSEFAMAKASAAENITSLEAKVVSAEARVMDEVVAGK
jgi:vacuolar-type H+-ATPase subunit D/Vma8